jgi:hypothetical protein
VEKQEFTAPRGRITSFSAESFEKWSSGGKNCLQGIGELEFKLKQAREAALTIANNPPAAPSDQPRQAPQDKRPTPNLAPALETISTPGMFWVYLGQYQQGKFLHQPNFTVSSAALPKPGDALSAATDTYERDAPPVQVGTEWRPGNILGVVRQGQSIIVRQVDVIQVAPPFAVVATLLAVFVFPVKPARAQVQTNTTASNQPATQLK